MAVQPLEEDMHPADLVSSSIYLHRLHCCVIYVVPRSHWFMAPARALPLALLLPLVVVSWAFVPAVVYAQEYDQGETPTALDLCNGIFISYTFQSREKSFPKVKNASAQAWAFKSVATIVNAGDRDLKLWQMFIGFQHREILVSADGAVLTDGGELPIRVGNGTSLSGFPQTDLKTSIETAGDWDQIRVNVDLAGTQFGIKPPGVPMPATIRLLNEGYKCPAPTREKNEMHVCCVVNPKFKSNETIAGKFEARKKGDLNIMYDVLSAYEGNYLAQVSMDNHHPLGRLDNWNLTWEWKRGEFIHSMKGAVAVIRDASDCIYGPAGVYYSSVDFSQVMTCEKKPIIADLPPDRAKDNQIGNIPNCCRNGTLLPEGMDPSMSKATFQMVVYKIPPDMNRTTLSPPQNWKINGVVNPNYVCGPPARVSPTDFPDPSGLISVSSAVASWQIVCNITRPKTRRSRCCVSFSAYYNDSVVPCNTCACGCAAGSGTCDANASPLLLPSEALLVPFDNRTEKARAWARIKHRPLPAKMPCGDNCGVSINWHVYSDYRKGWTARITIFNWDKTYTFKNWFAAVEMKKAFLGYENVYSFNGTKPAEINDTIFFQGLPGLNYLMALTNGTHPEKDSPVPGKQQSVISFTKKQTPGIDIARGDGFPNRVFFNGEECALPSEFPRSSSPATRINLLLPAIVVALTVLLLLNL